MNFFNLGDKILALLETVFAFWNYQTDLVFSLLGQSPASFKGGEPWRIIMNLQPLFVAIGSSLAVLFFVIGFCAESIDIREEMRFGTILKMLMRIVIAQWLVVHNITILKALFTSIGNLVNLIGKHAGTKLKIDPAQAEVIQNLGFWEGLLFLILTLLLAVVIILFGFMLVYTVYFRFLKMLIIVPLGPLAYATLAGNRTVSQSAVSYSRYYLSVLLEAVTMALAIILSSAFINAGLPEFTGDFADWTKTLIYLCEMTFTVALTVGSVKGAQNLTSRALGL